MGEVYQSFIRIPALLLTEAIGFGIIQLALGNYEC